MQTVTIKNKQELLELSDLTLGAGRLGEPGCREEAFRILDLYLEKGGTGLDVARFYANGHCEEELGYYLQDRGCRNKIVLISKGGFPLSRDAMYLSRLGEEDLRKDLHASLQALRTDHIDLYFLHRDDCNKPVEEIMPVLHRFVQEGKVRQLGASNWTAGRIGLANRFAEENGLTPFSVSQINWSLAQTTPPLTGDITHIIMNDTEFGWYREHHFPVMAYSVQAKGFFSKHVYGGKLKPSGERSYLPLEENFRRAERLKALSEELNLPFSVLLLSYIRSQPLPSVAIGGFSSVAQAAEGLCAAGETLSPAQIAFLENGIREN